MLPTEIQEVCNRLCEQTEQVVIGQQDNLRLILVAILVEGHVLLEGVPGTGKTLLAKTICKGLGLEFGRIQFTPDLMPGDLIGTNLFNFQTNEFILSKGPIFTDLLLADEINRTPPKTQAALLEAMQERSVTLDGKTHDLGNGFLVIATQNPIEQEGTYPLPEAELDRFLLKLQVGYPEREEEIKLVSTHGKHSARTPLSEFEILPIANMEFLEAARASVREVLLSEDLVHYIVDLVRSTREHPSLLCGGSPRSAAMLAGAARANAVLQGRDYAIADDVKDLLSPLLAHRLVLAPGVEIDGTTPESILLELIEKCPAPR